MEQSGAAPLILTTGTIEANFASWHVDPYRKPDRQLYLAWEESSYPGPETAENCGAPFRAVRGCGCRMEVIRDHCDRKTCEHNYCCDKNRARRARDIEDRMEAGRRQRALIYTVLTVPPRLRGKAVKKDFWKKAIGRLAAYLRKYLDMEYACERSDPAGEDRVKWHPHVNLLWVRRDGKGYISPEALEALKTRWKRILGEHPENPVSVWTAFAKDADKKRRRHWYSYMGRTWPEWEGNFKYHCRIKWLGKPAKKPVREKEHTCPKCGLEVAIMRTGTQEAAAQLAARGYQNLLAEMHERISALRRSAPIKKPLWVNDCWMPRSWFETGLCELPKGGPGGRE